MLFTADIFTIAQKLQALVLTLSETGAHTQKGAEDAKSNFSN